MSIAVQNITKKYGSQIALNNISFTINKGEIVGFLGPNGAGKSTLMKIITTYLAPDSGAALVAGFDVATQSKMVQKAVGYLPEHNPLYLDLYVREYLEFNASLHKISKNRIDEVIQLTGLTPESHKKISDLSKGYRQRVGIATALLHNPEVLILDEPTTGLDPNQLVEIRNLIKNIGKNKTVFLSTHIMQEVEAICDRILIIDKGTIVTDKKLKNNNVATTEQLIEVEFDNEIQATILEALPNLKETKKITSHLWHLTFSSDQDMRPAVFDFATKNKLRALQIVLKTKNIEELFREKTAKK
jgi:ABC-2 type transport system ATP-binding protein